MLTHAARQFVLMQRFLHNPKRQRGILLRSPQLRRLIQRHEGEHISPLQLVSSAIPR